MSSLARRDPVLFRWRAADGLGANGALVARSYRTELAGVFTRASTKWVADRNGLLIPRPHSIPGLAVVGGEAALLLEPASTNLLLRSQEIDDAAWTKSGSPTVNANARTAPDGTLTADQLVATLDATSTFIYQVVTFIGDGTKVFGAFVREDTAGSFTLLLRDTTAGVTRHEVRGTWTSGVPVLSTIAGAGTLFPVIALRDGWFFVAANATGVVAANTNEVRFYLNSPTVGTIGDAVHVWGLQAENAAVPSSYIPTAGSTVTRAADSLYFPYAAAPQATTVYVRHVNLGLYENTGSTKRLLHIGGASVTTDARLSLLGGSSNGRPVVLYDGGTTVTSASSIAASPAMGDVVEHRGVLTDDWRALCGASVNGAAEATTAETAASESATAWADAPSTILALTPSDLNAPAALTHVVVAAGERSMAAMRALAGLA